VAAPGQVKAQRRAGGKSAECVDAQEGATHERISGSACCCRLGSALPPDRLACLQKERIDGLERGVFANVLTLLWV